jgi:hypothetical protein
MTITNISVVGISTRTGAATLYIHANNLNYRVASPVCGGIPTIEIFVIVI